MTGFANCSADGQAMTGADVCGVPIFCIPIPFSTVSYLRESIPNIVKIIVCGGFAHNLGTQTPDTHGDEAGVCGGVASGTVSGKWQCIAGSGKVFINGLPETGMLDVSLFNYSNAVGTGIQPSQTKVLTCA